MDEKRLEILERAVAVYVKYGIKSVTMDDLSQELGMSKKTIYKYFADKNDLIQSIIEMKVGMDKAICQNCVQQSENAIDELINVSKIVVETVGNVNPTVFYDLQKYYKEAASLFYEHKWGFVLSMIQNNIKRGIEEGVYRKNIDCAIISRLYVASTDQVMNTEIFPWPNFNVAKVFTEMIHFHIRGMASDKGIHYLKQKMNNEQF